MIWRQCRTGSPVPDTHLVVDVSNVHDKVDLIAEVVLEDTTDNVLSEIVAVMSFASLSRGVDRAPGMSHMRRIIDCRTTVVPIDLAPFDRDELVLDSAASFLPPCRVDELLKPTFDLVSEL